MTREEDTSYELPVEPQRQSQLMNNNQASSLEILIGSPSKQPRAAHFGTPSGGDKGAAPGGEPLFKNGQSIREFPPTYFISRGELIRLSFFNFPYGLICGTMALCILPSEASRLSPLFQSYCLGFFLGLVGLSQLVCPLVGKISDLYEAASPFGQRIPFFVLGTVLAAVSITLMWLSSYSLSLFGYSLCLLTGMCGLNICTSIQTGLVPSFVDQDRSGEASGVSALGTLLGASTGFGVMALCHKLDYHFVYPLYVSMLALALAITVHTSAVLNNRLQAATLTAQLSLTTATGDSVEEQVYVVNKEETGSFLASEIGAPTPDAIILIAQPPTPGRTTSPAIEPPSHVRFDDLFISQTKLSKCIDLHSLLLSYHLPLTDQTRDFFWVFIGRTCYYVAVSVQAFILYYLRDVVNTTDKSQRMVQTGIMALTAQTCAAIVAYPLGRTIDSVGVSRKLLIYLACFIMSLCYAMLAASPVFGVNAFYFVWVAAVVYGIGNGCFLAVDYSIALTTLPDKSQAAQSLGIWGLSAFVGSAVGPLIWGLAIQAMGSSFSDSSGETTYCYWGYFCMLAGGILATFLSALSVATLRSVR